MIRIACYGFFWLPYNFIRAGLADDFGALISTRMIDPRPFQG